MVPKKKVATKPKSIINRRATFDYEIGDDLVVGIALTGLETRAARDGHVQLKGSYVTIRDNELWLNNASFSIKLNEKGKPGARSIDTAPRKLLASRKQIDGLAVKRQSGLSIVPMKLLTSGRFIKLVIALGKGKKNYDKRETIKRRDQERDIQRAIKNA
ncbi:SsrA-binding protein SmpB [Candidatus Saccharibacteria bacterium]|nr:SsrA-binding protein SmpB [Candidatus Saccharibacteria bacterium]